MQRRAWFFTLFIPPLVGLVMANGACKESSPGTSKTPAPIIADVSSADAAALTVVPAGSSSSTDASSSQVSARGNGALLQAGQYKLAIDEQSTTCPAIDAGPITPTADQTFGIQLRDSADGKGGRIANVPVVFDRGYGVARFNVRLEIGGHGNYSNSHTSSACSFQTLHGADVIEMSSTKLVLKVVSTYGEILGSCPTKQPLFSRCNRETVLTYTLVKAD
jgi:hypothetical protein